MAMDFSCTPSLKQRALIKIAISLLNKDDIQKLISKCPTINSCGMVDIQTSIELIKKELKKVENKVLKYVLRLSLPGLLKKELLSFVEVIGWQLIKWREWQPFEDYFKRNFTKFQWTPQGTIDIKKSAEVYINDESIPVHWRYIIACEVCLKDYVCTLWKQLKGWPEHKGIRNLKEIRIHQSILTSYWSHYIKGKLHLLNPEIRNYCNVFEISPCFSLNEYIFYRTLLCGNVIATRYFLQKLTPQENARMLLEFAEVAVINHNDTLTINYPIGCMFDGERFADTAAFLISRLNEEQQKEIFGWYPHYVLKCFLIWPRQAFFMKLAKSMFCCPTQLSSDDRPEVLYYTVLKEIASKIASGSIDYNYRKLLAEFWHVSHHTYKKYVIKNYASNSLLSSVFKVEDTENIQFVLKDSIISRKRKSFCN